MAGRNEIEKIVLSASPYDRGVSYGQKAKAEIHESIERMDFMAINKSGMSYHQLSEFFLSHTKHVEAAKKWTPHLLQEVEGIAEGANLPFPTMFTYQCWDELARFAQVAFPDIVGKCTSIGKFRTENSPTLLGQNLDTSNLAQGLISLLHIKLESGIESLVLAHPGHIAQLGVNNKSLGVCVNEINLMSSQSGLPCSFIIRQILELETLNQVQQFLQTVQHGAAQNYMIGDQDRIIDFECSANKVVQFQPKGVTTRMFHTNHHMANDDAIPNYKFESPTTHNRLKYIQFRLMDSKPVDITTFKYILRSHIGPICVHGNDPSSGSTWLSVIYELTQNPSLHVTIGPPCSSEYQTFSF